MVTKQIEWLAFVRKHIIELYDRDKGWVMIKYRYDPDDGGFMSNAWIWFKSLDLIGGFMIGQNTG